MVSLTEGYGNGARPPSATRDDLARFGLLLACILVGARIGGIGLCIVTGYRARLLHADLRDAAGPAAYHSGMILAVAANPDASTRSMNVRAVP